MLDFRKYANLNGIIFRSSIFVSKLLTRIKPSYIKWVKICQKSSVLINRRNLFGWELNWKSRNAWTDQMSMVFFEKVKLMLYFVETVRNKLEDKAARYLRNSHFPSLEQLNLGSLPIIKLKITSLFSNFECLFHQNGQNWMISVYVKNKKQRELDDGPRLKKNSRWANFYSTEKWFIQWPWLNNYLFT